MGKGGRYHIQGDKWKHMGDESPQLLAHLLKKLNLDKLKIKLLDALFVWTEPHSKRLKINVNIEKEVLDEKLRLSSRIVVEFVVKSKQCIECIRESTDHSWGSLVQVRQRSGHQRLDQLEKLLVDKGLHNLMLDVNVTKEGGFDLYFKNKNQGDKVTEVITAAMPVRRRDSKKLVSTDRRSQTAKMEHTTLLEVVPLNKDDLVILTKQHTGGRSDLFICSKTTSNLHFTSPSTLQKVEISAAKYYQCPLSAVFTSRDLVRYVVLDITPLNTYNWAGSGGASSSGSSAPSTREADTLCLAEAEVVREDESGGAEGMLTVVTHLGNILKPGDLALGYHLVTAQVDELVRGLPFDLPDCVLVKKTYKEDGSKGKKEKKKKK